MGNISLLTEEKQKALSISLRMLLDDYLLTEKEYTRLQLAVTDILTNHLNDGLKCT